MLELLQPSCNLSSNSALYCLNWALGVDSFVQDNNINPPVLLSSRRGIIAGHRGFFSKPLGCNTTPADPLSDQLIAHGIGPVQGKVEVRSLRPRTVGIALDEHVAIRVFLHKGSQPVDFVISHGRQGGRAGGEQHIAYRQDDAPLSHPALHGGNLLLQLIRLGRGLFSLLCLGPGLRVRLSGRRI